MLVLERLYGEADESLDQRFARLKGFELAFSQLKEKQSVQIQRLRILLNRYRRLSALYGNNVNKPDFFIPLPLIPFAALIAGAGIILNFLEEGS